MSWQATRWSSLSDGWTFPSRLCNAPPPTPLFQDISRISSRGTQLRASPAKTHSTTENCLIIVYLQHQTFSWLWNKLDLSADQTICSLLRIMFHLHHTAGVKYTASRPQLHLTKHTESFVEWTNRKMWCHLCMEATWCSVRNDAAVIKTSAVLWDRFHHKHRLTHCGDVASVQPTAAEPQGPDPAKVMQVRGQRFQTSTYQLVPRQIHFLQLGETLEQRCWRGQRRNVMFIWASNTPFTPEVK